jgi:hypothetical protein
MSGILVDIWWRSPFRVLLEDCGDHKGGRHYSRNAKCPHESRFPLWSFLSSQLYSRCQTLWCLRTMSRKHLYNIYSQKKPLNLHKMGRGHKFPDVWASTRYFEESLSMTPKLPQKNFGSKFMGGKFFRAFWKFRFSALSEFAQNVIISHFSAQKWH